MNYYNKQFKSLNCYQDVTDILSPILNFEKEVSESFAIIKRLKKVVLKKPQHYDVWDLCAGNALTSTLSAFMLPINKAHAIDIRVRERSWDKINKFEYLTQDIFTIPDNFFKRESVLIAVHPCAALARQVCKIYNESDEVKHLILMPCCVGSFKRSNFTLVNNRYYEWCIHLNSLVDGYATVDEKWLSPRNVIISASKKKEKLHAR